MTSPPDYTRIQAALEGEIPLSALTPEEVAAVNIELDARITRAVRTADFTTGPTPVATVALDDDGTLVEYRADGTTAPVEPPL